MTSSREQLARAGAGGRTERTDTWAARPSFRIEFPSGRVLDCGARAHVMGVLNVTPDSFSDGGRYFDREDAVSRGLRLAEEGADLIDVGGESTRPGSRPVSADDEKDRVLPVIERLADRLDVPISIDTQKSAVAAGALDAGAGMVNDVSALRTDPDMAALVAERGVPVCLMHMQGTPATMQQEPTYREVVTDIIDWLRGRIDHAVSAGIEPDRIIVDPGFGFGKTLQHNLELLRRLDELHALGRPLLVGTSRKSMLGAILGAGPDERLNGTLATVACAVMAGCHVVRVHDVRPAREAVAVCQAIRDGICYRK